MHLQSRSSWAQLTIRRVCVISTPSGRMFGRSVEDHVTRPARDNIDVDIVTTPPGRRVRIITTPSGRMFGQSVEDHVTRPARDSIDVDIVNLELDESRFTIGLDLLTDIRGRQLILRRSTNADGTYSIGVSAHAHSVNGTFVDGEQLVAGRIRFIHDGSIIRLEDSDPPGFIDISLSIKGRKASKFSTDFELEANGWLGSGACGVVCKARHLSSDTLFAVKIVRKPAFPSSVADAMISREIRLLERLKHPNIVRLAGVYNEPTQLYIVMELVLHGDLSSLIRDAPFSELQARRVIVNLCDALQYAHSLGIVHRDIKPANILIAVVEPLVIKLADFGLAKRVHGGTILRSFCGTPMYMAPEIFRAKEPIGYDSRVDSWSMGVTLFEMLSKDYPFSNDGLRQLQTTGRCFLRWAKLPRHTSLSALGLILSLLDMDPMTRPRISQVMQHKWLTSVV